MSKRMTNLKLRLLGGYAGTLASGEPLQLATRKAWALLAYLALHPGREISRERLAALLWGQRFEEQARASLRQTLYELRTGLGEPLADRLVAKRDRVELLPSEIEVDVLGLERCLGAGTNDELGEVVWLYRGPLLDGLEIVEPGFEEWLAAERARLHDLAIGAFERCCAVELERGRPAAAIETARQLIRLDPLSERAHRLLMRGLAAEGRRSELSRQFRDLSQTLETELGVAPDPETVRLRDELMASPSGPAVADRPTVREGRATGQPALARPVGTPGRGRFVAAAAVAILSLPLVGWWLAYPERPRHAAGNPARPSAIVSDQPAIAVLPFQNLSPDPRHELLADGLTEDLTTALSKASQLLVAARTSTRGYADSAAATQDIARDLGVRYLLEGGVQNAGDDLRVTVRLIDATVGHSIWSDRYDRELGEVFALQDDIVREVLVALQVELLDGEHAKVASRGTTNLDAWLLRLQAMNELYKFTRASTVRTRELLEAAHQVDPNWSRPLGGIAWSYWWEAKQGWTDDRERWIERGVDFAERAIALAPDDTLGYMQLGNLMQLKGDHARAVALREKAVEIAPNDFQATWGLGTVLFRAGEPERAIQVLEHAQGLSPRQPPSFLWGLAQAQLVAGQYEDAIRTAEEASARGPDDPMPIIQRVAGLSGLGRMDDAHAAVAELLRIDPDFSASAWKTGMAEYADQMAVERLAQLLIDAGLPL